MTDDDALARLVEEVLLYEAITALRAIGRIVQKVADPPGTYRVDGGAPLSPMQVVALAWDTGRMNGSAEIQ